MGRKWWIILQVIEDVMTRVGQNSIHFHINRKSVVIYKKKTENLIVILFKEWKQFRKEESVFF